LSFVILRRIYAVVVLLALLFWILLAALVLLLYVSSISQIQFLSLFGCSIAYYSYLKPHIFRFPVSQALTLLAHIILGAHFYWVF